MFGSRAVGEELSDFGGVAFGVHRLASEIVLVRVAERLLHHETDENRVLDTPGMGFVAQKRELQREAAGVGFQVVIDAARVGGQHGAVFTGDRPRALLRQPGYAQPAELPVAFQRGGTGDFGKLTGRQSAKRLHLPEAVLGGDEALGEVKVIGRRGADVWNAQFVAFDNDRLGNGSVDRTALRWQRPPREPIDAGKQRDNRDGDQYIDRL